MGWGLGGDKERLLDGGRPGGGCGMGVEVVGALVGSGSWEGGLSASLVV